MLRSSEEYTEGPIRAGVMEPPSEDQQKGQDIAVRDVGGSTGKTARGEYIMWGMQREQV